MIQDQISQLNLARKWRSQTFDQVIGQDLVIRILKNSLYKSYYFPVYLFMGQRGCGKTSTARIFAAAVNCQEKALFQKDPKKASIPCLTCYSCTTIAKGQHPDFIEIDAASHTGVDNVRQIIDSASFMPVLGEKKIYLIDEAHMLSKAAFNALLKILEEPPLSVIFILATTDAQKIIDTVRSRCFQLFFKPVESVLLAEHLALMCEREGIGYDREGIASVVQQSQGSVRDAQNMLEQIRFSGNAVTKKAVLLVLGAIDDEHVAQLLLVAFYKTPAELFALMQSLDLGLYNPAYIWKRLHELLRVLVWYKYTKSVPATVISFSLEACVDLLKYVTIRDIQRALEIFYTQEALFAASSVQLAFLEMVLLQLAQIHNRSGQLEVCDGGSSPASDTSEKSERSVDIVSKSLASSTSQASGGDDMLSKWSTFVAYIQQQVGDQLVVSLFKQAAFMSADHAAVTVSFGQDMHIFVEQLLSTQVIWIEKLRELFGMNVQFVPQFDQKKSPYVSKTVTVSKKNDEHGENRLSDMVVDIPKKIATQQTKVIAQVYERRGDYAHAKRSQTLMVTGKKIDVSDARRWPLVNVILTHFPGRVTAIEETVSQQNSGTVVSEVDEQQQYLGDG